MMLHLPRAGRRRIWLALRPATARANLAGAVFMSAMGSRPARRASIFRTYARISGAMTIRFDLRWERGERFTRDILLGIGFRLPSIGRMNGRDFLLLQQSHL